MHQEWRIAGDIGTGKGVLFLSPVLLFLLKNKWATFRCFWLFLVADGGLSQVGGFTAHLQLNGKFNKRQQSTCYLVSMGKKLALTIALLIVLAVLV